MNDKPKVPDTLNEQSRMHEALVEAAAEMLSNVEKDDGKDGWIFKGPTIEQFRKLRAALKLAQEDR